MQSSQRLQDMMHKADWTGDREKKNWEFVHLLLELVDEERHITRLQKSVLAFTVDYWWHIRTISFGISVVLHFMVIFGLCSPLSPPLSPPLIPSFSSSLSKREICYCGAMIDLEECVSDVKG